MKQPSFAAFAAALFGLAVLLSAQACKKPKTLDTVLKDIPAESYSLNFQDLPSDNKLITQVSYGKRADGFMLDIDEICPPLKKIGYRKIPPIIVGPRIFVPSTTPPIRLIVLPTCVEYVPMVIRDGVLDVIRKSGLKYAQDLKAITAGDKAVLLSQNVLNDFQNIQPDRMDLEGMKGVDLDQVFVMIPENLPAPVAAAQGIAKAGPGGGSGADPGYFKRGWYGQRYKDLKIPPKYIGCFDPVYLNILRDNLIRYNQAQFGSLNVIEIDAAAKTATLGF
jgi:hypothetical protein